MCRLPKLLVPGLTILGATNSPLTVTVGLSFVAIRPGQ
jgi:hypothetical protein